MYQGHHADGSGIQAHSAGPIYPFVLGLRETNGKKVWFLDGPFYLEHEDHDHLVSVAQSHNQARKLTQKPVVKQSIKIREPQGLGLEAGVIGTHAVGVRERLVGGEIKRSYFVVGPRAKDNEFKTHQEASLHIDWIESDIYTIEKKLGLV